MRQEAKIYKNMCPICDSKIFNVKVGRETISVNCAKCKRSFLACWNEWVLNMDGVKIEYRARRETS